MAEFSEPELEAASPQVASREVLWSHFLRELRRYGQVRVDEGEVHLVVEGETVPHRFVATPDSLRQALVCGHALSMRHRPDVPPMQRLPVWFLTDLDEDIGSHEDPADEPYVKLDDFGELHRSARAEPPPLRAPREPPSRDGAVPGGHWSDSHGNRFDGGEDDQPAGQWHGGAPDDAEPEQETRHRRRHLGLTSRGRRGEGWVGALDAWRRSSERSAGSHHGAG